MQILPGPRRIRRFQVIGERCSGTNYVASLLRANVPLAALLTFVTNPFTLPFWLVVANKVGNFTLRMDAAGPALANAESGKGAWAMLIDLFQMAGATAFTGAVRQASCSGRRPKPS